MNINPTWTEARVERLTKLWRDGKSATEIAIDLGGVTRNAVIGKVSRLNLHHNPCHLAPAREKKAVADRKRMKKREQADRDRAMREQRRAEAMRAKAEKAAAAATVAAVPSIAMPAPLNFSLIDLNTGDCRFPVSGEKAATLFCGHNVETGSPYCTYHGRVAYIPREVRLSKKRAA